MTRTHDQVASVELGHDNPAAAGSPGRRSRTEGLPPSIDRIADRVATVLQRRAAAGATVAPTADQAVERASASSGSPLPTAVRGQFESSLGTDLSAVRVHTGDDSATAAEAVGARAYATGNDIHFASGMYQPADPFGLHLLAHEVAHTVQQSSTGPTTQFKLDVSTPGDAYEVEADCAADAMVRGAPAAVSGGGSGVQRAPADPAAPAPAPAAPAPAPATPMPGPRTGLKMLTELDAIHTAMAAAGHPCKIAAGSGLRTIDEQIQIYAKGRTLEAFTTDINAAVTAGTVTQAKATEWIAYYTPIPAAAPAAGGAPAAPAAPAAGGAPAAPAAPAAGPAPGGHPMPAGEPGPVTWTFNSRHLTGNAADIVHTTLGWEASTDFWAALKTAAEAEGLQIGPPASDVAHVEKP